jgi:hypothetical protein
VSITEIPQSQQELQLHLCNSITDLTAEMRAHRRAAETVRRMPRRLEASGIADAAGNAVLTFERCPMGAIWALMRLVVGGTTWGTALAGSPTAVAFVTSSGIMTPDVQLPLNQVVDEAPSLPNIALYTADPIEAAQVPLSGNDMLIVLIVAGTSGVQYNAAAQFRVDHEGAK